MVTPLAIPITAAIHGERTPRLKPAFSSVVSPLKKKNVTIPVAIIVTAAETHVEMFSSL